MKVTVEPLHIAVALDATAIVGVISGVTVIVILFEVAVVAVAQFAFELKTHATISPFAKVLDVNVAAFAPETAVPFTVH